MACRREDRVLVLSAAAPTVNPVGPGSRWGAQSPLVAPAQQEVADIPGEADLCACFTVRRLFLVSDQIPFC